MKSATEFLARLRTLDVKVWVDADRLRYSAPEGVLTAALRSELVERKAELISFLRDAAVHARSSLPPIVPLSKEGELPLSFAQQRLWFISQFEGNNPTYNIVAGLRLSGRLDTMALEQSIAEILRRHESLRTTFITSEGKPSLRILPKVELPLPIVDFSGLPEAPRKEEALRIANDQARFPFVLSQWPLMRVSLLRMQGDEHILLLSMHHIISDGWSTGILMRELAILYESFVRKQPSPLADLPIQYSDFARWQRETMKGEALEAQLAYWKTRLSALPSVLELPADRSRPAVQSHNGALHEFTFPPGLTAALKDLCRKEGVTLFMALLAAFQTLLYRHTSQEDMVVGTPIANRNRGEIDGLIGFFVNTLVMRTDLSGRPAFRELLHRVREAAVEAYAHQDLPFEVLVEALQPERGLAHSLLFQVMFALQEDPGKALELPGLKCELMEVDSNTAKFDLTLFMKVEGENLRGVFEFNTDLFHPSTIRQMGSCLQVLLQSIASDPNQRIDALSLLTEERRNALVVEWSGLSTDYPREETIGRLFEIQTRQTPDSIAVVFGEHQVTYGELNDQADALAQSLRGLGIGPEAAVGIFMDRSLEMIVAHLGILKAGGAYMPLDPAYPRERLQYMLAEADVPVLLTQERLRALISGHLPFASTALSSEETPGSTGPLVICLDGRKSAARKGSNPAPESATAEGLAYVMYTSGSTGVPKGVRVVHRGVVRLVKNAGFADLGRDQVFLQLAPISFDAATLEIWAPLLNGGKLVVLPPGSPSLAEIGNAIQTHGITTLWLTSSLFHMMVDERVEELGGLRQLLAGGDVLSVSHVQKVLDRLPGVRMINGYGPTENTTFSSCYPASGILEAPVPIGRPIANSRIYILDRNMQPVPPGVPGELFVGGDGLGRDYLDQPALTAERFTPNPFPTDPRGGERLYRTGDLARYLRDRNVEFLGRMDSQVKIRGFRIEPKEIESALAGHPNVREAIVIPLEYGHGDKRLAAYVVPRQSPGPDPADLRDHLKQRLPEYMVPSAFVMLESFPVTPSGKIDRRALPKPDGRRPDADATFVAPRTLTEETIAKVWSEVLGLERVGVHDNFFELGGDSILSIQVVARAAGKGLHFTPKGLFQNPTVAALARVAARGPGAGAEPALKEGPAPLTPVQRWFFEQEFHEPHHWNQSVLFAVKPTLVPGLIERCVGFLTDHHDALRLRFEHQEEGWHQTYAAPEGDVPFCRIDLSQLPEPLRGGVVEACAGEAQASLDLKNGPIFRVVFFTPSPEGTGRLLFAVHHLAVDGVSWRILLEDFQSVYERLRDGTPVHLPAKTTSYRSWARRMEQHAQASDIQGQLPYWAAATKSHVDPLPVDFAGGENIEASEKTVERTLSPEDTAALLLEVYAAYGVEINEVLLAALAMSIENWTGSCRLLVDMEGHGREDLLEGVDVSRTVGWFTSIYPVLLDPRGAKGPVETLKAVKEQLRRIPARGIGYGLLRYLTKNGEALSGLPRAQISFNYLGRFDQRWTERSILLPARESPGPERSPNGNRTHYLGFSGSIVQGRLRLVWSYSENLHKRSTIQSLADDLIHGLTEIVDHCRSVETVDYTPSDFPDVDLSQSEIEALRTEIQESI